MTQNINSEATGPVHWEADIRRLEESARVAFLFADVETLNGLWAETFTVNSPFECINDKEQVLELLRTGAIRHATYECEIEALRRHGDVVTVMGRDRITGPPAGKAERRYTNIWQLQDGTWRTIARHAQLISGVRAG